jgi:hypothetical protein
MFVISTFIRRKFHFFDSYIDSAFHMVVEVPVLARLECKASSDDILIAGNLISPLISLAIP